MRLEGGQASKKAVAKALSFTEIFSVLGSDLNSIFSDEGGKQEALLKHKQRALRNDVHVSMSRTSSQDSSVQSMTSEEHQSVVALDAQLRADGILPPLQASGSARAQGDAALRSMLLSIICTMLI